MRPTIILRCNGNEPELFISDETDQRIYPLEIGQIVGLLDKSAEILMTYAIVGWKLDENQRTRS